MDPPGRTPQPSAAHQQRPQPGSRRSNVLAHAWRSLTVLPESEPSPPLPGCPQTTVYQLPVDQEQKATQLRLLCFSRPHMRAWHLSWAALFVAFLSSFSPAALVPQMAEDLGLTVSDIGASNLASVAGAIPVRLLAGSMVDRWGPRISSGLLLLGTAPAVFCMALVHGPLSLLILRLLVGVSLGQFVVGQAWVRAMFSARVLGVATSMSAGWGNAGGGVALLLMPALVRLLAAGLGGGLPWRVALFLPGVLQVGVGVAVLLAADDAPPSEPEPLVTAQLEDPASTTLLSSPPRQAKPASLTTSCTLLGGPGPTHRSWTAALINPRTWLLGGAYALCFGVELTVHNVLVRYLVEGWALAHTTAGAIAGAAGMLNLFTRAAGGSASDVASRAWGMRGRCWVLWASLAAAGAGVLLLGASHTNLAATVVLLGVFSVATQAACGAVYAVVPFVSTRSNGLVVGVVAALGVVGALLLQLLFLPALHLATWESFFWMGVVVLLGAGMAWAVYFPQWGGMCCGPRLGATEEAYYLQEYTPAERAAGVHLVSLAFAYEARANRSAQQQQQQQQQQPGSLATTLELKA